MEKDKNLPKKNNFPELEEEDEDSEEEFEISTKFCPYLQARSFFQKFFPKNVTLEYLENFHKNNPQSKYPSLPDFIHYKNKKSSKTKKKTKSPIKCPFGYSSSSPFFSHPKKNSSNAKCPFGFSDNDSEKDLNEINLEEKDSDSGDEINEGGCPVMGKNRSEPVNKDFKRHYEIPLYGPFDFLFYLKGDLEENDWKEKTEKIRNLPRHLKYTLFYQDQPELENIHKLEFPKVFFMFDELKQKGIRYYNRRKFDIEIKSCYMDEPKAEEESYKSCVVYILLVMAYCFIELRHYSSAINCLNECEKEAGNLVPDVFLRRAQALICKKNISKIELEKAEKDLEKSIQLAEKFNIELKKEYDEMHPVYRARYINLDIYYLMKKKICDEEHKNMKLEEALLIEGLVLSKKEDIYRYYKVFKEMKKQYKQIIKFFSETKNQELLDLTYDEYEKFMDSYDKFKFYYNFELDNIDPKAINRLNEEEKKMINDETKYDFYLKRIMHICENIYSHGYYNLDVFRFSLETVLEQEMKEKEEQKKEEEKLKPKINLFDNFLMKISKGKLGIYITICFLFLTFIAIGSQLLA